MKKTKKPYVHIHKKNRLKGAIMRTYRRNGGKMFIE